MVSANPMGPVVVKGQAAFATAGNVFSVTNSPGAIINWQQFSISAAEATRFIQQSASSSVLNRVTGGNPSAILGTLQSNGRVFLINPNGVLFGAGSRIDVAGLVASTLNLTNEDFLTGRMRFGGDAAVAGTVVNMGHINAAPGGRVYLVGSSVDNQGTITAPNGDIVLAAGRSARITDSRSGSLQVEVTAPVDQTLNLSEFVTTPVGAYAGLVRNSGVIRADAAVVEAGGRIVLKATRGVTTTESSVLSANGATGGTITVATEQGVAAVQGAVEAIGQQGAGGRIAIAGAHTGLFDGARIDASGTTGGGTILVGGDFQGRRIEDGDLTFTNSLRTYVAPTAALRADAVGAGDGGKVVVWADEIARYYGSISARGGAGGGNGGFVETSGKGWLDFQGLVDTRAPMGAAGTLLLDPTDITISTAASTPTLSFGGSSFSDTTTTSSNLNVTTLTGQLGLSNVIVTTASALGGNGDITVNNAINYTSANSLTLNADRNITVVAGSGGINNLGTGALTLTGSGTGSIAIDETISTSGGTITLTSGSAGVTLASAKSINAGSGLISINAGGGAVNFGTGTLQSSNATASAIGVTNAAALTLGNVALTGGGTLSVSHSGAGTQTAATVISGTGALTKSGAGTLTLSASNTYTGTTTVNAGTLSLSGGNAIANTGAVVLANVAGVTLDLAGAETIGNLSGGGATGGNVTLNANTLTTGDAGNTTYSGVISGTGGQPSRERARLRLTERIPLLAPPMRAPAT